MLQAVTANWVTDNPVVSIPTTKNVRTPTSAYTVYCMKVKDGERTWSVEKRFSAFESFRDLVCSPSLAICLVSPQHARIAPWPVIPVNFFLFSLSLSLFTAVCLSPRLFVEMQFTPLRC